MLIMLITTFGYIGMVMMVVGFYLISNGTLNARSLSYQTIQCVGSLLVGMDAFFKGAYPSMLLQFCCIAITIKTINSVIANKAEEIEKLAGK